MSHQKRLLEDDERRKELATGEYKDTELGAVLKGPKVTEDEYRERVVVTELAPDSRPGLHGYTKATLPADPETIDQFITVLMQASLRLSELLEEPARLGNLVELLGEQCADCGRKAPVYGPLNFDGEMVEEGDFCCRTCAIDRGVVEGPERQVDTWGVDGE